MSKKFKKGYMLISLSEEQFNQASYLSSQEVDQLFKSALRFNTRQEVYEYINQSNYKYFGIKTGLFE